MANISETIREARLRWLGHDGEKDRGRCSNENMGVSGHRKIGRPRLRWSDVVRKNTKEKRWKKHKTGECGD